MAVTVIRPPIASDPAGEVPRSSWGDLISERHQFCTKYLPKDCRLLLFFIEDGAANQWLGYGSCERYIVEGLGLDLQMVDWAIQGLRRMRPEQAVSLNEIVVLGNHGGDHGHGRDSKGRFQAAPKSQGDNVTLGERGNSAAYTAARLDRDGHSDLAAKVRAKEISANAAAIEAGFRKPRPADPHPGLTRLRRAWEMATSEERAMFMAEIKPR